MQQVCKITTISGNTSDKMSERWLALDVIWILTGAMDTGRGLYFRLENIYFLLSGKKTEFVDYRSECSLMIDLYSPLHE